MMPLSRGLVYTNTEYPFAKGALTTDGAQYSATVTALTAATAVETVTITPYNHGSIIEAFFSLDAYYLSSATNKDVTLTWQAKNHSASSYVNLVQATVNDPGTTETSVTYSGYFKTTTNFDSIPFDVRLTVAAEDTNALASARIKNSSYVTVKWKPSVSEND